MYYKYKCDDDIIRVFTWCDNFHTNVYVEIMEDENTIKEYERAIEEDDNGKFFTWNEQKIYLDNWIRMSMKELQEKINNGEYISSNDICTAILSDGVDNVRFMVPFPITPFRAGQFKNRRQYKKVLCKIKEEWNREVQRNYKIIFVPVEKDDDIVDKIEYYNSDIVDAIRRGGIVIVN